MASSESFSIRNRSEFDEFWMSGVEHGQMQTLGFLESLSGTASESDRESALELTNPLDDPPVTAQVWWKYATEPDGFAVDLLIDPGAVVAPSGRQLATGLSSGSAVRMLRDHVIDEQVSLQSTLMAAGFGFIAIRLTYQEMVTRLLPLTRWRPFLQEAKSLSPEDRRSAMRAFRGMETAGFDRGRIGWFLHLLAICGQRADRQSAAITYGEKSRGMARINELLGMVRQPQESRHIGRVTLNRPMSASVSRSQRTVKVDATRGLFGVRCDTLRWAVVDSGIDARHDWFRALQPDGQPWPDPFQNSGKPFNYTRIVEAFDFTRQRTSGSISRRSQRGEEHVELPGDVPIALALGERFYEPPRDGHGTHIAGIIGGSGGLCPDIQLYDYRVLGEAGRGNEFAVVTALRYILEITQRASHSDPTGRNRDIPIHGVNLSVALDTDVTSDACGWSLVCRVCDELVRAGVVVVVAAGNTASKTDPGLSRPPDRTIAPSPSPTRETRTELSPWVRRTPTVRGSMACHIFPREVRQPTAGQA